MGFIFKQQLANILHNKKRDIQRKLTLYGNIAAEQLNYQDIEKLISSKNENSQASMTIYKALNWAQDKFEVNAYLVHPSPTQKDKFLN